MDFSLTLPADRSGNVFGIYGRAMYLAMRFEDQISALAFLLTGNSKTLANDRTTEEFSNALARHIQSKDEQYFPQSSESSGAHPGERPEAHSKAKQPNDETLSDHLQELKKILGSKTAPALNDILNKARKARNRLVHPPGLFINSLDQPYLETEELETVVKEIACAQQTLYLVMASVEGFPVDIHMARNYPSNALQWVLGDSP